MRSREGPKETLQRLLELYQTVRTVKQELNAILNSAGWEKQAEIYRQSGKEEDRPGMVRRLRVKAFLDAKKAFWSAMESLSNTEMPDKAEPTS